MSHIGPRGNTTIYVLRLDNKNVFYVGATMRKVENRIIDIATGVDVPCFVGKKKFNVEETLPGLTPMEEMTTTLRYMRAYGIDNVRGACWSNLIFSQYQINMISNFMDILTSCERFMV